jgi:hypothetical protein
MDSKLVFIIAHKYYRGYNSFLHRYISNIISFYKDALIIIVDNNSEFKNDIFSTIELNSNIILLDNNTDCKFEIGAYKVGIQYLLTNNLIEKYDYVVMTQDTFFLNRKYDFNNLVRGKIEAASIIGLNNDCEKKDVLIPVLQSINLYSEVEKAYLCWCNSLILSKNKIKDFFNYIKDIVITRRYESEASERYLGKILFELNNGINYAIDGNDENYNIEGVSYNCLTLPNYDNINKFFIKVCQQKNEGTVNR